MLYLTSISCPLFGRTVWNVIKRASGLKPCRNFSFQVDFTDLSFFLFPAVGSCGRRNIPSGANTELKRSPFKAWSRSVYSHTCYAYCQGFLLCSFLPLQFIHLYFSPNLSRFLLCWLWLTHGSCSGPQDKTGHPVACRFPCRVPAKYK